MLSIRDCYLRGRFLILTEVYLGPCQTYDGAFVATPESHENQSIYNFILHTSPNTFINQFEGL